MATSGRSIAPDMGVGAIISKGIDIVTDDYRISGLQFLASLVSMIPLLGWLLQVVIAGLAIQFADETIGSAKPEKSIFIRALLVILTVIVMAILVTIGFVFLIVPGIYLSLKFSLAIPAVWLGGKGPLEALSDSWSRTSGHLGTILGVGLVFLIVALLVLGPAFFLFMPLGSPAAIQQFSSQPMLLASPPLFVISTLYSVTVGAVIVATQAVMYRSFGEAAVQSGSSSAETQF